MTLREIMEDYPDEVLDYDIVIRNMYDANIDPSDISGVLTDRRNNILILEYE